MIEKYETKASKNVSNISGSPLGMWIDAVTKKTNHTVLDPVTRALKYIMLFEPEHEIIDGINLRDCYELLYSLSEGKPTKVLNEKTKDFLNYTLTMLARDLQQEDLKPEKDYLHSNSFINNLSNGKRTYAMRDSVQGNSDLDCSINPLQIPENLFKKSKTSES